MISLLQRALAPVDAREVIGPFVNTNLLDLLAALIGSAKRKCRADKRVFVEQLANRPLG